MIITMNVCFKRNHFKHTENIKQHSTLGCHLLKHHSTAKLQLDNKEPCIVVLLPVYESHNKSYQGSNLHKPALLNTQYCAFRHLAPKLSVTMEWANSHNR